MKEDTPLIRSDSNIFNEAYEKILNNKGNVHPSIIEDLVFSCNEREPEILIRLYDQIKVPEIKNELGFLIGARFKERGLIILLDYLYTQNIGNGSIRTILKKYSLLDDVSLEPDECDAIISIMLDFLEIPAPNVWSWDEEVWFKVDLRNRESAARILVVLNGYSSTSKKAKTMIQNNGGLVVINTCIDRLNDVYGPTKLSEYLSGRLR